MPEEGGGGSRAQMDQEALLGAWTLEGSGLIKAVLGTEFPREGGLGCTSGIWKVRVKRLRESRLDLLSPRLVGQQWVEKRSLSLSFKLFARVTHHQGWNPCRCSGRAGS